MPGLKLKPRDGIWYAIGTVAGKRIRESLGTREKGTAEELRAQLEARLWKRHTYGEAAVRNFEEAALSYLQQGGEGRYVPRVLKYFKGRAVGSINPGEIRAASLELYPHGSPATRNRQAIIPTRAIINHAHSLGWCGAVKVKQFEVPKSRKHRPVDRAWIDAFMAEADRSGLPYLSACVLFMHQTGARVSEAIRLLGEHVNLGERVAVLERTKTDEWHPRYLSAELVLRIGALGLRKGERVFRYTDFRAVNRRMKAVCKRAGVDARSTHSAGRHSFATNTLDAGAKIKDAMDAGGWKSAKLFMETYVHSDEAGRNIAGIFDRQTGPVGTEMAQLKMSRMARFGKRKRN